MRILLNLTKSILGELGGVKYLVLVSFITGISVPALFVESTISSLHSALPPNYLSRPDSMIGYVEVGGVKEAVLLACYKNISLFKESEKTNIEQISNVAYGIVLPLAYRDKALNSPSLRAWLNGSWRDYWIIGYYHSPIKRFVIIDAACGSGSIYDSNLVIYSEILGNVRSLAGLLHCYVMLSVLITTALSAWRARGGFQRITWAILTQGGSPGRLLASSIGASLVGASCIALAGISLGLVMSDTVAYVLARVAGTAVISTALDTMSLVSVATTAILATALPVSAIVVSTVLAASKGG